MPQHHATLGGMVISLCSAGDRLQDKISNFKDTFCCLPMAGQLLLFFSEASEVVLIYSIKYEQSCLSEQQNAVQGVTSVVICSINYIVY